MPQIGLPIPTRGMDNDQLAEYISKIVKDIEWLLGGAIDSKNIRNIAGFNVSNYDLKHISGLVGLSGYDPGNPLAVRIWAGDADKSAAPYRVLQSGSFYALDAFLKGHIDAESGTIGGFVIALDKLYSESGLGVIEGGTLRTAASGARIELSNNSLKTYNADDELQGLAWGTDIGGTANFGDVYLYHGDVKLAVFYDEGSNFAIRGVAGASGFALGGNDVPTSARGNWTFSNTISGNITNAEHADTADTATYADVAGASGSADAVSWSNVFGKPSTFPPEPHSHTFASLTSKPTTLSGYGITDAWSDTSTSLRSAFSAYRSGSNQAISAATYTKLQCNTESFDQKSEYDNATNYRFTASAAGIYQVSAGVRFLSQPDGNLSIVTVYVNGAEHTRLWQNTNGAAGIVVAGGSDQFKLNANDYVEIYVYTGAADSVEAASQFTRFRMTKIA